MSKEQKFDNIQMAELESKGCNVTPYRGWKGEVYFRIDKKKGIVIDEYDIRNGTLVAIDTSENATFEELLHKVT